VLIDLIQEALEVSVCFSKVSVFTERDFLLLDRTQRALGIAILGRLADGHPDLDPEVLQRVNIGNRTPRTPERR
jgi:hypothetical protein